MVRSVNENEENTKYADKTLKRKIKTSPCIHMLGPRFELEKSISLSCSVLLCKKSRHFLIKVSDQAFVNTERQQSIVSESNF